MSHPYAEREPDDYRWLMVRFHADLLNDLEDQRKRVTNRLLALTRDDEWGRGIPDTHPHIIDAQETLNRLEELEKLQIDHLSYAFADLPTPIIDHVENTVGLGTKGVARWLGTVLNPAWHPRQQRPRKLRELYAYCGLHVVDGTAPRNRRGQQSNWNNSARMRAWNMADPCIKHRASPYRAVYDEAKSRYLERDSDTLTLGQIDARARRILMKAIVRDLWSAAKEENNDN